MQHNFEKEMEKWDELKRDSRAFSKWLTKNKWKDVNKNLSRGMFKRVFLKANVILKFDDYIDGRSHTLSEHLSLIRSGKNRRRCICPSYKYYKGLLFQAALDNVCDDMTAVPRKIHLLAKKFRFSHYWNYGFLNGQVKFFDTDGLYYQLTDKEEMP